MARYRSIRFKLLFSFVAVILLPILTLGIIGPLVAARAVKSEAISHTVRLIGQVTKNIEFYIRGMEAVISILAENPDVQAFYASEPGPRGLSSDHEQGARRLLRTLSSVHPEIAGIILVNERDGYLSNEIQPVTRDPLSEERWYLSAVQNLGGIELLPRPIGRNLRNAEEYSADDVVSIVKAVIDPLTARCRGVVLIDMKLAVVEELLVDTTLGRGGFLFIEDRDGGVVYAPVNPVVYRVRPQWLQWPRTSAVRTIKGADYQVLSLGSEYTGWRTIGVFPLNEIMRQVGTIRYYSIITACVAVLLAFLASVFFTSSIARPVIELRALMKKAEAGDLGVRFEGRQDDEIGHLGRSFNTMIEEVQKLVALVYKEQQSKREAELRTLQEQIKPHFLYNTLDTIQWMAQGHGAEDIVGIVEALTRLFRIVLSKGKEMIAVRDELDHVRSYLVIQKARYEDKFDFTISVDEDALAFMMLKLTLQPLVENAIYHGIKERRGPGAIEVAAARRDGMLVFRVSDNGVGMTAEKLAAVRASLAAPAAGPAAGPGKNGYGLSNVHERIQLSFGPGYGLRFESSPGVGTTVELLHPLVMPEDT